MPPFRLPAVSARCSARRARIAATVAALTVAATVGAASGGAPLSPLASAAAAATPPAPPLFAAGSFWNSPLPGDAPVASGSAGAVARLARQAAYSTASSPVAGLYAPGYGAGVQTSQDAVPIWTVPANQPTVTVTLVTSSGPQPSGYADSLGARLLAVPVPTGISRIASKGSDADTVIYQPSTDTLWEFWRFAGSASAGYTAAYGNRVTSVSTSNGVYPNRWGARATSLALPGGLIRMADALAGVIPHAIALSVPVVDTTTVAPATRNDGPAAYTSGSKSTDALSEGMRFRLPAGFNCAAMSDTRPLAQAICVAARTYGLVIVDRGMMVAMQGEDPLTLGTPYATVATNPWASAQGLLWGPNNVVDTFPFGSLVQLAGCAAGGCAPDPVAQG